MYALASEAQQLTWRELYADELRDYPGLEDALSMGGPAAIYRKAKLSDGEMACMKLAHDGKSRNEICALTGVTRGNLTNNLKRGRQKLALYLESLKD